jgi:hypothetical protein
MGIGTQVALSNSNTNDTLDAIEFFSLADENLIWSSEALTYVNYLEKLVFQIARKPKSLMTHLRRIHYCFHANLNKQLFAALVDFLLILNKRGEAISWRMLIGAKSKLLPEQFDSIKIYLKDDHANVNLLKGNEYSILTKGFIGIDDIIKSVEKAYQGYDPLEIARDHIEYSQLDEAKQVLEKAIVGQPERIDLQQELLALYQSTNDSTRFYSMLAEFSGRGVELCGEWDKLNNYYKGLK